MICCFIYQSISDLVNEYSIAVTLVDAITHFEGYRTWIESTIHLAVMDEIFFIHFWFFLRILVFCIPQRVILSIMCFLAIAIAYAMRVCLSVAITEMVVKPNHTESTADHSICQADLVATNSSTSSENCSKFVLHSRALLICDYFSESRRRIHLDAKATRMDSIIVLHWIWWW